MRHFTRGSVLGLLVLASCASVASEHVAVPPALASYADIARFLLPGFRSVALSTHELEEPAPKGQTFWRRAFCGSDFEEPIGLGYGRYRGVEVQDFGSGGLLGRLGEAAPDATIAGVPVWHQLVPHHDGSVTDVWIACVDDRYIVTASHRELLERSLARTGDLATLLQPFAAVHAMPGDAYGAVCLLARPDDRSYWGRPVPIETTVIALCADRLALFHREPLPQEFLAIVNRGSTPATSSRGGWQVTEIPMPLRELDPSGLYVMILSGIAILL